MKKAKAMFIICAAILFVSIPFYKSQAGGTFWENVGSEGFNGSNTNNISLVFNPATDKPYVAYTDTAGSQKINVAKFEGSQWEVVGAENFSAGGATNIRMAFSPSTNQPYVAFTDLANGDKASVMSFNGSQWQLVGVAGFSAGAAYKTSIAFNPSTNEPYVAFIDNGNSGKATVMRFTGGSWTSIGTSGFSAASVEFISLAFNPVTSEPYISFSDNANSGLVTVMKYASGLWSAVGQAGFSELSADYTYIAFNPVSNEPYVSYVLPSNDYTGVVMRFNGATWETVPMDFVSSSESPIAFDKETGALYVAYADKNNSHKISVKKTDSISWHSVGQVGFSSGVSYNVSIAVNQDTNIPFVAFEDGGHLGGGVTVMQKTTDDVFLNSPNGGEVWHFGETQKITWTNNEVETVRIYIYDDRIDSSGSTNYITPNGAGIPAELESYSWTITQQQLPVLPNGALPNNYRIRIDGMNSIGDIVAHDVSDNTFTISAPSSQLFANSSISFKDVDSGKAKNKEVKLNFNNVSNATQYIISRNADFSGARWNAIKSGVTIKLSSAKEKKTYYVKFKDANNTESPIFKKTVTYAPDLRSIKNSQSTVFKGDILVQSGKRFSKNSQIKLYFSKPNGGWFNPMLVMTDKNGNFQTTYKVNKPAGKYSWYAVELKTGKKSKTINYTVK